MWVCLEVWMWVHIKYWISQVVRIFYSVDSKYYTYLAVHDDGKIIWRNGVTWDLQHATVKITMTLTIITDRMTMHCCINM